LEVLGTDLEACAPGDGVVQPNPSACQQKDLQSRPRLDKWAFGLEDDRKWNVFRQYGGSWRWQGILRDLPRGKPAELLKAFAEGGGSLDRNAVYRLWRHTYSAGDTHKILRTAKTTMNTLRKVIRKAIGIAENDKSMNPIPSDKRGGWQGTIQIGYAVKGDPQAAGGESRLQFRTREQLT